MQDRLAVGNLAFLQHKSTITQDLDGDGVFETVGTEDYEYDVLNQLVSVDYDNGSRIQTYEYDAVGNRELKTDSQSGSVYYSQCDGLNRLHSCTNHTYTYDANGYGTNIASDVENGVRTRIYDWDSQDRLRQCSVIEGGNTAITTYTYGADGLRRTMTCGNDTTRFILDGQSVVQEELNGNTSATYLLGPRGIEYRRSADEVTRWYIYDGLGSGLVNPKRTHSYAA